MSLELTIVLAAGLTLFGWLRFRDPIYPGLVQPVLWLLVLIVLYIKTHLYYRVPPDILALVSCGMIAFALGTSLAVSGHRPSRGAVLFEPSSLPKNSAVTVVFRLPILLFSLLVLRARELAARRAYRVRWFDFWFKRLKENGVQR